MTPPAPAMGPDLPFGGKPAMVTTVIGDVKRPLFSANFLRQHKLLVDVRGQHLIEADTYLSVSCDVILTSVSEVASIEIVSNKYRSLE